MKRSVSSVTRLVGATIIMLAHVLPVSASWTEQVLYSFQGGSDGQKPVGGVVFDKNGNLYGATSTGTVFQLAPPVKNGDPWSETVLYTFKGKNSNNDGMDPEGGLIMDHSGNLYGTTAYGGTGGCILLGTLYGCGTVYELSPPGQKGGLWTETILYSFQGGNDGYFPNGNLVFDKAGNLYGATAFGGGKGNTCNPYYGGNCGTVFKLSLQKNKVGAWTDQVLHSFAGIANGHQAGDGANPNGGLAITKGVIYGTTLGGGESSECGSAGCGTVFSLRPTTKSRNWAEVQLHVFKSGSDGALPYAGVTLDSKGHLYGTTVDTVFLLAPGSKRHGTWEQTVLWEFNDNAYDPKGELIFDKSHNLYGTTYSGNTFSGTVFQLSPSGPVANYWSFDILYGFTGEPDGGQPNSGLIFDSSGALYGTTFDGGTGTSCGFSGCGTVFKVWR